MKIAANVSMTIALTSLYHRNEKKLEVNSRNSVCFMNKNSAEVDIAPASGKVNRP